MNAVKVTDVQKKVHVSDVEKDVLAFWDETHAFEKSVSQRPEDKRYVFYDGPPFATGLPHYGHILASTIKDVVPRYFTMKGYRVDRVWGWDCHGIPIENMIEKELGLKGGKKGIEEMGIDKFNAACRSAILRFDTEWEKVINRIGRWVDFKHSYKTMDLSFMESVWWAFSRLNEKGLVYEGKRVILYCPRCATPLSNFEIAMDNSYKDLPGPSTVYKYKVVGQDSTYLLAWSTTPWNKLATPALAVNPDLAYVKVKQGEEHYILAESTLAMLNKEPAYDIEETYKGTDLEHLTFELHYDFYAHERTNGQRAGVVIADDYVTAADGTGIVTLAVYGEDDYRVMTKHNVQLVYHVNDEGIMNPEVTPWAGMFMLKTNPLVNEDLSKRGLIYRDEERLHSVPVCYRCETRLYHAPVPAWFIDVQKMKSDMLAQNENINWYPAHLKHGRFGKGLETAPDWNISRSRYWGTPMPIWKSGDMVRIVSSLSELKEWAVDPKKVEGLTDIHREFLDDIEVWVDDAKTVKGTRIPEVFDCWIESGSMPYASIHYPFENKDLFEKTHPAQFIAEYIAQTRAWFYTLHVMSVGLFGTHTFENAVTTGTILAEDGTKMSKSKKNYPDPSLLFERYGVDALRMYLMGSVVMKGENLNFSEDGVKEMYQKVVATTWNMYAFRALYVKRAVPDTCPAPVHVLDRWLISKLNTFVSDVTEAMDGYDTTAACRIIIAFINEFSTWYLRRSRDRLATDTVSQDVFSYALVTLSKVMAPVTPFIAERIYQNMVDGDQSVHLTDFPVADAARIDETLETDMERVRQVVEVGHAQRKVLAIPVRQPLSSATLFNVPGDLSDEFLAVVLDELNVKSAKQTKDTGEFRVEFDTTITEELKAEGETRKLIREIQGLRKELGCAIDEPIILALPATYKSLPTVLQDRLKHETLATELTWHEQATPSITRKTST